MGATTVYELTTQEDTFALAVIECGGNLGAAYNQAFATEPGSQVRNAVAKARLLIARPEVAKRIRELTEAVQEHAFISLGSHLTKLAEIRDLAIERDQLKVALGAEIARGQVVGFSGAVARQKDPNEPTEKNPSVVINIGGSPSTNQEWSAKYGRQPVVIDVQAKEGGSSTPYVERLPEGEGGD